MVLKKSLSYKYADLLETEDFVQRYDDEQTLSARKHIYNDYDDTMDTVMNRVTDMETETQTKTFDWGSFFGRVIVANTSPEILIEDMPDVNFGQTDDSFSILALAVIADHHLKYSSINKPNRPFLNLQP